MPAAESKRAGLWQRHVLIGCVLLVSCPVLAARQLPPASPAAISIQSVHLTAANHYVDLRYRVLDPEAAQKALGPGVKPKLIDEKTGTVMAVPSTAKLGSLRQTQAVQKPNHTYFVLFINGAGLKPGSQVTAELGSLTFRHLTLQ